MTTWLHRVLASCLSFSVAFLVAAPAAMARPVVRDSGDTVAFVGSRLATGYAPGRYPRDRAVEIGINLIVKYDKTIVKCGVNIATLTIPGIAAARSVRAAARTAGLLRWSHLARQVTPSGLREIGAELGTEIAAQATNGTCAAAAAVGLAVVRIAYLASTNGAFYLNDDSRVRINPGPRPNECRISISIGPDAGHTRTYQAHYRICNTHG